MSRLPARAVRGRAPLALARPSARGFGVDVGERTREREKADVTRFPPQAPERPVLVWCCELFLEKDLCIDYHFFLRKKSTSARRMAKLTRITAG